MCGCREGKGVYSLARFCQGINLGKEIDHRFLWPFGCGWSPSGLCADRREREGELLLLLLLSKGIVFGVWCTFL